MATRLLAGSILLASGLVAWLAVTSAVAARTLQAAIGLSMIYVGYLALRGLRLIRAAQAAAREPQAPGTEASLPFVSVVVPARDEAPVISDLVRDLAAQAYGAGSERRYEVVIVDDGSSDGTDVAAATEVATASGRWTGAPPGNNSTAWLRILRREPGRGPSTKGAVLAWATPKVRGEVIGALDADARVAPDFLAAVMDAWARSPSAAAIQASRRATNADTGWLQRAQDDEQLMDLASQCGRWATDGTAELRGNGMFVRRAALEAVGGWNPAAITEDLDLSTRLSAAGEYVAMAPDAQVGEEAVEHLGDLWRQRLRWAEGSLRRLMDHGPRLLLGPLPLRRKFDFLAFTSEFLIPPLFAAGVVLAIVAAGAAAGSDWTVPASLFVGYGLGSFLLATAGLAASGRRGPGLMAESVRGALFLSHWLLVVPVVLVRIAVLPHSTRFLKTPRVAHRRESDR